MREGLEAGRVWRGREGDLVRRGGMGKLGEGGRGMGGETTNFHRYKDGR